jgi:hypothetical protein
MFQPHSVRGLLSRRNVSRIQDDPADLQSNGDPDLELVVETKLFIKGGPYPTQTSIIKSKTFGNGATINAPSSTNKSLPTPQLQILWSTLISDICKMKKKEM